MTEWVLSFFDPWYTWVLLALVAIAGLAVLGWWFSMVRPVAGFFAGAIVAMLWAFRKGENSQKARDNARSSWRWPWQ